MANCVLDDGLDGLRYPDVAQETKTGVVPALHLVEGMLTNATDGSDHVAVRKTRLDDGPAHMAGSAKDLRHFSMQSLCKSF